MANSKENLECIEVSKPKELYALIFQYSHKQFLTLYDQFRVNKTVRYDIIQIIIWKDFCQPITDVV